MISAAIDIGTNTFRLLVAEVGEGGLQPLVRELVPVRLGEGLSCGDVLSEAARGRAMAALAGFKDILVAHDPDVLRVCATQALRSVVNGVAWIGEVREALGIDIAVISPREEALLGLTGALGGASLRLPGLLCLVDVGGGSTELVLAVDRDKPFSPLNQVVSVELGAVGLTERFPLSPLADADDIAALSGYIEAAFNAGFTPLPSSLLREELSVLAVGGTATALAALDLGLDKYDGKRVHGHYLDVTSLERIWERLRRLPVAERNRLPGLGQGRGEIILSGLRIYQLLLQRLGAATMRVSDTGLLEGIVLSGARATG